MTLPRIDTSQIEEINRTIFSTSTNIVIDIIQAWPRILMAIGIIVVGWVIMYLVRSLISKISKRKIFITISKKIGLTGVLERAEIKSSPNQVIGKLLGGYLFMMFFLAATRILHLEAISDFLSSVIKYIPNLVVALFIVLIGFEFSKTISALVSSALKFVDAGASKILGMVARNIIILFSILAALIQLNIAEELIKILFGGVVATIVIAGGLSLGLGSVDLVKDMIKDVKKKHK